MLHDSLDLFLPFFHTGFSLLSAEHPTPRWALYALLSPYRSGVRLSGTARVLYAVPEVSDVFFHPFERPLQVEGLQAGPHVVAFWIGAHELVQPLQPVAHQLRLAQLLGHRRNPLVRRPELGIFSFHRHLRITCATSYATTNRVACPTVLAPHPTSPHAAPPPAPPRPAWASSKRCWITAYSEPVSQR